jgi:hypothetical protein
MKLLCSSARVTDYGHRIRAVYGRIRLKNGVFPAVNGQIRAVYMPYFTVIQVDVYDRIHTVSYTACLRLKSDDRIWPYFRHIRPYYRRITTVYSKRNGSYRSLMLFLTEEMDDSLLHFRSIHTNNFCLSILINTY